MIIKDRSGKYRSMCKENMLTKVLFSFKITLVA